jgi:hypothetical protein
MRDDGGGQDLDGQAPDRGSGGRFELLEPPGGWGRPVAVTVEDAAELLAEDLARVAAAAAVVEPYTHNDGSHRWSLRELERELGRRKRSGAGSAWRGRSIRQG